MIALLLCPFKVQAGQKGHDLVQMSAVGAGASTCIAAASYLVYLLNDAGFSADPYIEEQACSARFAADPYLNLEHSIELYQGGGGLISKGALKELQDTAQTLNKVAISGIALNAPLLIASGVMIHQSIKGNFHPIPKRIILTASLLCSMAYFFGFAGGYKTNFADEIDSIKTRVLELRQTLAYSEFQDVVEQLGSDLINYGEELSEDVTWGENVLWISATSPVIYLGLGYLFYTAQHYLNNKGQQNVANSNPKPEPEYELGNYSPRSY